MWKLVDKQARELPPEERAQVDLALLIAKRRMVAGLGIAMVGTAIAIVFGVRLITSPLGAWLGVAALAGGGAIVILETRRIESARGVMQSYSARRLFEADPAAYLVRQKREANNRRNGFFAMVYTLGIVVVGLLVILPPTPATYSGLGGLFIGSVVAAAVVAMAAGVVVAHRKWARARDAIGRPPS